MKFAITQVNWSIKYRLINENKFEESTYYFLLECNTETLLYSVFDKIYASVQQMTTIICIRILILHFILFAIVCNEIRRN